MKRLTLGILLTAVALGSAAFGQGGEDPVQKAVKSYFDTAFGRLQKVADKKPTVDTLRTDMKSLVDETQGFFGGTLINTNFVITQVYFKRDALARGYDLKKVKQLGDFWKMMRESPAPQLSEPGHGNIVQPRLIAMRYPILTDGKLVSVVSIMIRTEAFLKETGLDKVQGYRITCRDVKAEEKGDLSGELKRFELKLPSTRWVIEYKP